MGWGMFTSFQELAFRPTLHPPLLLLQPLHQFFYGASKEADIVERTLGDLASHGAGLFSSICPEDDDACVVVLHGQTLVILGFGYILFIGDVDRTI